MPLDYNYKLQGTEDAWFQKSIILEIRKCNPVLQAARNASCASTAEVDDYVSRLIPEIWTNEERIDFVNYKDSQHRPTFRLDNFLFADLLDPNKLREIQLYIRKNVIEIEDALI